MMASSLDAAPMGISPMGIPPVRSSPVLSPIAVDDEDLITLLSLNLGGRDVAVAAWSNMSLSEKRSLRDQAVRIAVMAQGAELEGLSLSPDVMRTLRWGAYSFLADAWEKKIAFETDLSEATLRSFYEANRQRYMDSGAVRYRNVVYQASQQDVASRVKTGLKNTPLSQVKNCVTVGWTEFDSIDPFLVDALRISPVGVVMGPIGTPAGYVLYEVLERRKEGPIPFEKCESRVREDMMRAAIMERLEKLE